MERAQKNAATVIIYFKILKPENSFESFVIKKENSTIVKNIPVVTNNILSVKNSIKQVAQEPLKFSEPQMASS